MIRAFARSCSRCSASPATGTVRLRSFQWLRSSIRLRCRWRRPTGRPLDAKFCARSLPRRAFPDNARGPRSLAAAAHRGNPNARDGSSRTRRPDFARPPSRLHRKARGRSTTHRIRGSRMPIRGWARCSRCSSTATTCGCRSHELRALRLEPPADLRDQVWMPAHFTWSNDGEAVGFIPTRYPGSATASDPALALSHKTEWQDTGAEWSLPLGQRVLVTDVERSSIDGYPQDRTHMSGLKGRERLQPSLLDRLTDHCAHA